LDIPELAQDITSQKIYQYTSRASDRHCAYNPDTVVENRVCVGTDLYTWRGHS